MKYELTVFGLDHTETLRSEVWGDTPRVGDLVTIHPDDFPSERSILAARVVGIQRVIRPAVDPPGAPRSTCLRTTHVAVTARAGE